MAAFIVPLQAWQDFSMSTVDRLLLHYPIIYAGLQRQSAGHDFFPYSHAGSSERATDVGDDKGFF
jgi:hypothetical protein